MSWSWFCECVSRVCGWFSVGDEDWFWVGGVERGCGSLFLSSIFFPKFKPFCYKLHHIKESGGSNLR